MEAGDDGPNLLEKAANFVDGGSRGKSAKGGSNSDLKKTLNSLNRSISSLPQNISTAIQTVEISVSGPA